MIDADIAYAMFVLGAVWGFLMYPFTHWALRRFDPGHRGEDREQP